MHKLDQWLAENGKDRKWLIGKLGISKASLSRIINGEQWPGREFFADLAKITRGAVTADDFLEVA
jgi:transcriptional regulator with XRE-family HTH domain